MPKPLSMENLPAGRTMRAAHLAARTLPNAEVVKAGELVETRFAKSSSPSVAAIDGALRERRRDRLPTPAADSVRHESALATFETGRQVTDVPLRSAYGNDP